MNSPTQAHYKATTRILRYLKGSPGLGLFFPRNSQLQVKGFCDANWGGCLDTRRSITGYCFFVGDALISWRSKKQPTVVGSSAEVEYRALGVATCELQWIHFLLQDLRVCLPKSHLLFCDNQSALDIAHNPVFHERTKYLEMDCHLVREKLQAGLMHLLPIPSKAQLADFFTKALFPKLFHDFLTKLGVLDIFRPPA
uniref:Copia protein n=1 Tax=Cajanus cajan TaxID=3821 RepID=A0A151TUA0_CAJCA|nr:Copia protein [Cajanus cajan]